MSATLRKAAVAGAWYPGTAEAIVPRKSTAISRPPRAPPLRAEWWRSSLHMPACATPDRWPPTVTLSCAVGETLTAVLVGPSHRAGFRGVAAQAHGEWETPLGRTPVDEAAAEALLAAGEGVVFDHPGVHQRRALAGDADALPAAAGAVAAHRSSADGRAVAQRDRGARRGAGARARGPRRWCSWPRATCRTTPARARREGVDAVVVDQVGRFDEEALLDRLESHENVACGGGPIVAVMKAARALGADRATVLRYADSARLGGRQERGRGLPLGRAHGERVMNGRGSDAAPCRPEPRRERVSAAPGARVDLRATAQVSPSSSPRRRALAEECGAFVTLAPRRRRAARLRGADAVGSTAGRDRGADGRRGGHRGRSFRAGDDGGAAESGDRHLGLGPMRPIRPEAVEVGRHGLLISCGRRRGVLLPAGAGRAGLGPRDLPGAHLPEGGPGAGRVAAPGQRAAGLHGHGLRGRGVAAGLRSARRPRPRSPGR